MMRRKILLLSFIALLVNWFLITSTVRINDITLSDSLGLFSVLPLNFTFALILLVLVTLLSVYLGEHYFSILFAILFSLYFHVTPWIIEPLRINDSLFHYSRVAVINSQGYLPTLERYYFDFPGAPILGSSLLAVTGLDYLVFLKFLFPVLTLFVFQLGLSLFLYKLQGLRFVGLGLLLASLFGWGSYNFSPEGLGRMLLPLLLYLLMKPRKAAYSACFIVLVTGLAVSHPTTSVFLALVLFGYLIVIKTIGRMTQEHSSLEGPITRRSLILVVIFLSWTMTVSNTIPTHLSGALQILLAKIFHPLEAGGQLVQPVYPLFGISLSNYVFLALSTFVSIAILLRASGIDIRRRRLLLDHKQYSNLLGPSMILVGLVFTPTFFIAGYGQYALTTAAAFAFLGASISLTFLNLKSKRTFFILAVICLLLVVPSFISNHAYEHYNIIRDPIKQGLIFSGQYMGGQNVRIYIPFGNELWAFLPYDMWDQVISIYPLWGTTGGPIQYQGQRGDYFIYRIDGSIYASLQIEGGVPLNETSYFKTYTGLLNSSSFDPIYSSKEYEILFYPP